MASSLYDWGREGFLAGDISWRDHDIRLILVDAADYTLNLATHKFLSDVPVAARVAISPALANKTTTAGVADADNTTFPSAAGDPSEALIIYQHKLTAGVLDPLISRLIGWVDTVTGPAALSVTPNGGDILVTWSDGASKIFKL